MSAVRFETPDALGLIIVANPQISLFDQELIEDLRTAVNQTRRYPLRALLGRADGKNFSGGADVATFKAKTAREARERFTSHLLTIRRPRRIAVSNDSCRAGACMAAGLELALAYDLIWRLLRPASGRSSIDGNNHVAGRRFRYKVTLEGR